MPSPFGIAASPNQEFAPAGEKVPDTFVSAAADYCLVYNYYAGVTNPSTCTATPSTGTIGNNGNVIGYYNLDTYNSGFTRTEAYGYDKVNRLTSAAATGNGVYNLAFGYDAYGNMTCIQNGQTNGLCPTYTFTGSNQVSGFTYDGPGNVGNLTSDGTHSYTWDAEGRNTQIDGGTSAKIVYNALGQMVNNLGNDTQYDPAGERIVGPGWSVVPRGNVPLVKWNSGNSYFIHSNALESSTFVTDQMGAVQQDQIFYPWGQQWKYVVGSQDGSFASLEPLVKTGGEETGNALYRHYGENYGRWLSPDPAGLAAADLTNPQSLNLYAYVMNNPATLTDPLGLCPGCPKLIDPSTCDGIALNCTGGGNGDGGYGEGCGFSDPTCAGNTVDCELGSCGGGGTGGGLPGLPTGPSGGIIGTSGPLSGDYGAGLPPLGPDDGPPCDFGPCGAGYTATDVMAWGSAIRVTTWACGLVPEACIAGVIAGGNVYLLGHDLLLAYQLAQAYGHFLPGQPILAKGGKGNVSDTGVLQTAQQMVASGLAKNICDALEELYTSTPPGPQRNKINATQKQMGCRGH